MTQARLQMAPISGLPMVTKVTVEDDADPEGVLENITKDAAGSPMSPTLPTSGFWPDVDESEDDEDDAATKRSVRSPNSVNLVEDRMRNQLFKCSKEGDVTGAQNLLLALQIMGTPDSQSAVQYRDEKGMTILHWAAREGHDELVKYLIHSAGADVLDRDAQGMLPSQHAKIQYFTKLSQYLASREFNRLHHIARLQSWLRRFHSRKNFVSKHTSATALQGYVRLRLTFRPHFHFGDLWFKGGDEGRHTLARFLQARLTSLFYRRTFVEQRQAANRLTAGVRRRLARLLYLGARVFCSKAGQEPRQVMASLMGRELTGKKVSPMWRTPEYVNVRRRMRHVHEQGIAVMHHQKEVKEQFERERMRYLNMVARAATLIQALARGVQDRARARVLAAQKEVQRQAALAERAGKLFSLYSDPDHAVCIHVTWAVEGEIQVAQERYLAVLDRPGGVHGVCVLAIRSSESIIRERRQMEEEMRARLQVQRDEAEAHRMVVESRQVGRACLTVQCWFRCLRAKRRADFLRRNRRVNPRPDLTGALVEKKRLKIAKVKTQLHSVQVQRSKAHAACRAAEDRLRQATSSLQACDDGMAHADRQHKAALAGRRHREALTTRHEWERLRSNREDELVRVENASMQLEMAQQDAAELDVQVSRVEKEVKEIARDLEQYNYRRGRGRPPKHEGQYSAMTARERLMLNGRHQGLRGVVGVVPKSDMEHKAATTLQRVMRGHVARKLVIYTWAYKIAWARASEAQMSKAVLVQALARGWLVRSGKVAMPVRKEPKAPTHREPNWRQVHLEKYRARKAQEEAAQREREEREGTEEQGEVLHGPKKRSSELHSTDTSFEARLERLRASPTMQRVEKAVAKGGWFQKRTSVAESKQDKLAKLMERGHNLRREALQSLSHAVAQRVAEDEALDSLDQADRLLDDAKKSFRMAGPHGAQGLSAALSMKHAVGERRAKILGVQKDGIGRLVPSLSTTTSPFDSSSPQARFSRQLSPTSYLHAVSPRILSPVLHVVSPVGIPTPAPPTGPKTGPTRYLRAFSQPLATDMPTSGGVDDKGHPDTLVGSPYVIRSPRQTTDGVNDAAGSPRGRRLLYLGNDVISPPQVKVSPRKYSMPSDVEIDQFLQARPTARSTLPGHIIRAQNLVKKDGSVRLPRIPLSSSDKKTGGVRTWARERITEANEMYGPRMADVRSRSPPKQRKDALMREAEEEQSDDDGHQGQLSKVIVQLGNRGSS